jgi:hypothetical protein
LYDQAMALLLAHAHESEHLRQSDVWLAQQTHGLHVRFVVIDGDASAPGPACCREIIVSTVAIALLVPRCLSFLAGPTATAVPVSTEICGAFPPSILLLVACLWDTHVPLRAEQCTSTRLFPGAASQNSTEQ